MSQTPRPSGSATEGHVAPDAPSQPERDQIASHDQAARHDDAAADRPPAPATGDLVIDAATRELAQADDLESVAGSGEQLHRTLQARLDDLGS